jgi:hypothetical protein
MYGEFQKFLQDELTAIDEAGLFKKERIIINYNLVASWDSLHKAETQRVLDFVKDKQRQVFCFSAGPLSKIWIPICLSKYPNNIYLDIILKILTKRNLDLKMLRFI